MRLSIVFFCLILCGCGNRAAENSGRPGPSVKLRYAEGFTISKLGNATLVEVKTPFQGAVSGYKYLLVRKGEQPPTHDSQARIIYTPVENIVCTSTTHIPLLDYLGETEKLIGFPTTDYISSEKMRARIDAGHVTDLGIDKGMNLERLATLRPALVMGYTMNSDYGQFKKIEELNIPVVINAEYLEKHPLGRAEWIKFMALFFGREKQADSVFSMIEMDYQKTKQLTANVKTRPTVLSGVVYGDAWFLPGGENYAAKLLKDAGCQYLWEGNNNHGYLQLSFESVYEKAHDADLWIGTATFKSLREIRQADLRYTRFKAFLEADIYNYDAKQGAKGGNEFLELGYLRPDLVLKDLVRIAHPQLLPDHTLFFHRKLP
jgi:iron complex transport system substrate-binding protein